jgi:adenine-specific DNA-methyltransferase
LAPDSTVVAKTRIADSVKSFQSGTLAASAFVLFKFLGYSSDKTFELEPNTVTGLLELANQSDFLNPEKAHSAEWKTIDFLFQLTDEEVRNFGQTLEFDSTIDVRSDRKLESYIFLAVELKKNSYTRTALADMTREINRLFPMPALVLFKHGDSLTFSIINRRIHKRDVARDVLEKVTLIKDISISNPHRGHIEILFDLALPQLITSHNVTNFVQLDEAWRKTLDISLLNKRFYKELANWYFWALQHVEFPKQPGVSDEVNRATNVIRLITRLIFVWFLKERELVPEALFDRPSVAELLNDFSQDKSTFYKAILQNLFFATLNTPMNDPKAPRLFRSETSGKRFNDQYMVHNQYRYQKLFSDPEHALDIFASIPFLNGGLFECLDKREEVDGKWVETRIDGFSDVRTKQPTVPNRLFFGDEEPIDLNETYGTRGKRYTVRGLIDTLNRYKFTIAENTPIEEEVALDPELLGKVFENLLASYNPETGASARKQTGSFYTPREIVNYMVDESLIAYLKTQVKSHSEDQAHLTERLHQLFAYTGDSHQFSSEEVDELIAAIDAVKILDPACGSGAFPMGILQRLVFILSKLDPNNAKWEQRQIKRVHVAMGVAQGIEDHKFRENTLKDLEAQIANIEDAFARNELDYGRKLFLIENCIYGVDIQPIAIQIAKLRFFISLIIDQRIQVNSENLGIRPLPNLETKFVAANALVNVEKPAQAMLQNELLRSSIDGKERELKIVRERHFTARTTRTKEKYRKEDERLRREIGILLEDDNWPSATTKRLVDWNPYDQNASADFFDAEWMFGLGKGFDVAIGNPPYIAGRGNLSDEVKNYLSSRYESYGGKYDLYIYFIEKAIQVIRTGGQMAFIVPNVVLTNENASRLRAYVLDRSLISKIKLFEEKVFGAQVESVILILQKSSTLSGHLISIETKSETYIPQNAFGRNKNYRFNVTGGEQSGSLVEKLLALSCSLGELSDICIGIQLGGSSGAAGKDYFLSNTAKDKTYKRVLDGRDINRYSISWPGIYVRYGTWLHRKRNDKYFLSPKIVFRQIGSVPVATFDSEGFYTLNTIYNLIGPDNSALKFYLGIINSKVTAWYWQKELSDFKSLFPKIKKAQIESIPIPHIRDRRGGHKEAIEELVGQMLDIKREDPNATTTELDNRLNLLVYDLYELTSEERLLIETFETQ